MVDFSTLISILKFICRGRKNQPIISFEKKTEFFVSGFYGLNVYNIFSFERASGNTFPTNPRSDDQVGTPAEVIQVFFSDQDSKNAEVCYLSRFHNKSGELKMYPGCGCVVSHLAFFLPLFFFGCPAIFIAMKKF